MKLVVMKVWVDVEDDNDAANIVIDAIDNAMSVAPITDYAVDAVEDSQ